MLHRVLSPIHSPPPPPSAASFVQTEEATQSRIMAEDGTDISFDPYFATRENVNRNQSTTKYNRQPLTLQWEDLKFEVPVGRSATGVPCLKGNEEKGMKTILSGCSGEIKPGGLLAIMGSSGAGKTTLLNLLAGRVTSAKGSKSSGRVLVNGEKRDFSKFRQVASYVLQDDDLFAELTVREQVEFGAMLRLPNTMPTEKKQLAVDRVITELSLSKVANTNIGNELMRGVSGGERKRVSIGTELVTNPSMLFLDEPTSGLDAFNALNVITTLRRLAYNGRTVVTTIHQPRSNIYSQFDMLLLLSQGRVMYFGPAKDAVAYFSALNFHCPAQFNPADYFIDLISVDSRSPDAEALTKKRVAVLADKHSNSAPLVTEYGEDSEMGSMAKLGEPTDTVMEMRSTKYQNSWVTELRFLAVRAFKLMVRERTANFSRLGQTIVFSILLGLIWLNAGRGDSSDDARSLIGILFFLLINRTLFGLAQSCVSVCGTRIAPLFLDLSTFGCGCRRRVTDPFFALVISCPVFGVLPFFRLVDCSSQSALVVPLPSFLCSHWSGASSRANGPVARIVSRPTLWPRRYASCLEPFSLTCSSRASSTGWSACVQR